MSISAITVYSSGSSKTCWDHCDASVPVSIFNQCRQGVSGSAPSTHLLTYCHLESICHVVSMCTQGNIWREAPRPIPTIWSLAPFWLPPSLHPLPSPPTPHSPAAYFPRNHPDARGPSARNEFDYVSRNCDAFSNWVQKAGSNSCTSFQIKLRGNK